VFEIGHWIALDSPSRYDLIDFSCQNPHRNDVKTGPAPSRKLELLKDGLVTDFRSRHFPLFLRRSSPIVLRFLVEKQAFFMVSFLLQGPLPDRLSRRKFTSGEIENLISFDSNQKGLQLMKSLMKSTLVILGIALCTSTAAYAHGGTKGPEIDPSLAVSGFTLLAGTLTVLRVQRKK
jgi:hypothetical protein